MVKRAYLSQDYSIRDAMACGFFVACLSLSAWMALPLGPVPIVMQNMFVLLSGIFLGPSLAFLTVLTFLIMGALGMPVFAHGASGLVVLFGPTGGFLWGYLLASLVCGYVAKSDDFGWKDVAACLLGVLCFFLLGLPWLAWKMTLSLQEAIVMGCLPFLPGAVLKIMLCLIIAGKFKKPYRQLLSTRSGETSTF